ncbi:type II toxin-antitoxin system HicB family antitoxin [Saccharopolyspora sp. K220]|uniref:type II toxin-antitoxin system HicB family antitoxin n=1 Tax=Saccharopolyspora soli TaxID=2926618 RepID=UPI001F594F06|nr:type II toxin-antitoxin system HicB family antitoxin [Saccharopolyspora soli]MCI2423955.1 type II toxin-antitoxin system HicB family antitoxin [Saccharopolyspora soli]
MTGYVIIIERDEEAGFSAWAPDLPGVVAAGETYEECVSLMRDAVRLHLAGLREHGAPVPAPSVVGTAMVGAA